LEHILPDDNLSKNKTTEKNPQSHIPQKTSHALDLVHGDGLSPVVKRARDGDIRGLAAPCKSLGNWRRATSAQDIQSKPRQPLSALGGALVVFKRTSSPPTVGGEPTKPTLAWRFGVLQRTHESSVGEGIQTKRLTKTRLTAAC
jgi:hypothetical protein